MSGFCGWSVARRDDVPNPDAITTMAAAISRHDGARLRSAASAGASLAIAGTAADLCQNGPHLACVWGPARFANAELAELAAQRGAAYALSEGYQRHSINVLGALSGSFALAVIDTASGETILATDKLGTRPVYYADLAGKLVFSSALGSINAFPASPAEIDAQAIYDYVHYHMIPAPRTIYAGRRRLLPGSFLRWRDGKAETETYWELRFVEDEKRPFKELKDGFLDVIRTSVREAAAGARTGAFLSGGTDSSTIAGMLGEVTGQPARTYSIGFEAEGYDEMHYARVAARHFGTNHHEYYVTADDVVAAIPRIAAVHDQPFGNSSAVPTFYCAKLAKEDGIEILLGGDGGDELFGGNERYAKQYVYSLYSDLPRPLRNGLIEPIVFRAAPVSIAGKVQRYIRHASEPMPGRYDIYNLLSRLGASNIFTSEFLSGVDQSAPQTQMSDAYNRANARTLINRMLALDLRFTLADNDLPKVMRSCELAGVDVRFPMLEDAVVAFSARLEPSLKLKRTQLRFFFKEALRGFLPEEIIRKKKHGFGLPFGPWMRTHPRLQALVRDSLESLKGRDIVRADLIDELLSHRVAEHAAYYGTMAWVLMMLEQWYQQHRALSPSSAGL
jgi:asparagine synthase (glutamine-hydrolysing)